MNPLSIFIYLAATLPKIAQPLSEILLFFSALLIILSVLRWYFEYGYRGEVKAEQFLQKVFFKYLPIMGVVIFLCVLVPDKQTIYMIAASELGETTLETQEAQELYQELKTVLKHYTSTLEGN